MARVYESLEVNGRMLNSLFDTGAVRSYIARHVTTGLPVHHLEFAYEAGLGGERRQITEACFVQGRLQSRPLDLTALVVDDLGRDERGRPIGVLFGAEAMEVWNIRVDPKAGRLDLSRLRQEFIEYQGRDEAI